MAVEYLRCPACGSSKKPADLLEGPLPEPATVVNSSQPGRKGRIWTEAPLAVLSAQALRRRLAAALERLDEEIRNAE